MAEPLWKLEYFWRRNNNKLCVAMGLVYSGHEKCQRQNWRIVVGITKLIRVVSFLIGAVECTQNLLKTTF